MSRRTTFKFALMKRGILIFVIGVFLSVFSMPTWAVELTIRNEEQCDAKVALAYQREGLYIVEGWYKLQPRAEVRVRLYAVPADSVFAHVVYEYPQRKSSVGRDIPLREAYVQDTHFRYAGKPEDDPAMYKATFLQVASTGLDSAASNKADGSQMLLLVLKAQEL